MATPYRIGIQLSLVNAVSRGLGLIRSDLTKTDAQAKALQRSLNSIKLQAFVGAGMFGAGFMGLKLLSKTLPDAREYAHQLNIMNMAGLSHVEIAQAVGAAWKNTRDVITTTATENLKSLLDLRNVLGLIGPGGMGQASRLLPIVSKVGAVMASSQQGRISQNAQDIAFSMAKSLDILGKASDVGTFARNAGEMSKVISAFQGRVSPRMFQSVFAFARQAKFGLSEDFIYRVLPTLMLEFAGGSGSQGGGSRGVGPSLAAFVRFRDQGYVNRKAIPELQRLGLMGAGGAIHTTTSGTTIGAMRGSGNGNFFDWVQKTLVPAINARFGGQATRAQTISEINQIARGNQLAAQLMLEFALKQQNFMRDARIISGTMPYDKAYDQARRNDPEFQFAALRAQENNVLTKLGLVILPSVISGTMALTDWMSKLIPWMDRNKGLVKDLVWGFAGLSGALMFGGSVLLLTAAFRGLGLVLGIGGPLLAGASALRFALLPLAPALLAVAGAAAVAYAATHPVKGRVDASGHWHPAWEKGTFWDRSVNDVAGDVGNSLVNAFKKALEGAKVVMDGKEVGRLVSKEQARAANGPVSRSPARFNPAMSPAQP